MWFDPSEGLNPQDLCDRIADFWSSFANYIYAGITVTVEPVVDSVDSETGLTTSSTGVTPPAPIAGTGSGDPIPPANQLLVQLRTGVYFTGRELRGRMFIPGAMEGDTTGGQPVSGYVTTVQNAAQSLADDADQVVYSPTKREFADVSVVHVWEKYAVLRSRRD